MKTNICPAQHNQNEGHGGLDETLESRTGKWSAVLQVEGERGKNGAIEREIERERERERN